MDQIGARRVRARACVYGNTLMLKQREGYVTMKLQYSSSLWNEDCSDVTATAASRETLGMMNTHSSSGAPLSCVHFMNQLHRPALHTSLVDVCVCVSV